MPEPNGIISVTPSISQGLQDYSHNLYSALSPRAAEFRMLCNVEYTYQNKSYAVSPIYGTNPISDALATVSAIRKFRPEVVHSQSTNLGLLLVLIACKYVFGFKLVLTPHSSKSHFDRPIYERLQTTIYNACDGLIWHTEQDRKRMLEAGVDTPQAVIDHGNYDFYTDYKSDISRTTARSELGVNDDSIVFLFFGYLREDKRLDLLLESFSNLPESAHGNAELLIAGQSIDDDLTSTYLDLIEEYDIADQVHTHIGFVENEDVPLYFEAADVLVTPYDTISESGVVNIGFAFGLPVIATDVEGFSESFVDGKNGKLVSPDNPVELTSALTYAIENESEMRQMGENNRKQSEENSWESIAQETLEFYETL
ncbi:glycosyltransferase family 4 protein [Halorubrum ezzemoulense]|uniref:glycosyltransferase family 4 protein n=1 Tax=Halorubrum ezzemoulense TaxID=337243 RepID=UPI00232BBD4B|nr:glycosyltransferase family 4 protein [Halorubrum ezzemoulense]MDB2272463.1 glycosyltransferase family 4 protein [Halorubrum ezzemoulense]